MELKALFKKSYGKDWADASFFEKAEAMLLLFFVCNTVLRFLFPKD